MSPLRTWPSRTAAWIRKTVQHDLLTLSMLGMVVGAVVGGTVIVFLECIALIQFVFFGFGADRLADIAAILPWWQVLLAPAVGGLIVGPLIHFAMPERRPHGVPDAIEASALSAGRMSMRTGFFAVLASALSIGCGASVGREGPAVHLGASIGSWFAQRLGFTRLLTQTLLGCGVAAAVSASFNAPIAGALFASEVVIGHYALRVFAPVVMASVIATMVSRAYFGPFVAFAVPAHPSMSIWELPAFLGLGIVAGVTAAAFVRATGVARMVAQRVPGPPWLRPAVAGLAVGAVGIVLPGVLGIGYGITEAALAGALSFSLLVALLVAKVAMSSICLGFGFGGGVFSPSLVIGAMLGGAFGVVATHLFPWTASTLDAFVIVGMGAVSAAVLGAPISTTLIIFEMTGDYNLTIVVLLANVLAMAVGRRLRTPSMFVWILEQRGLDLVRGLERTLLQTIPVRDVVSSRCEVVGAGIGAADLRQILQSSTTSDLIVVDDQGCLIGTLSYADLSDVAFDSTLDDLVVAGDVANRGAPILTRDDDLETALRLITSTGRHVVPVVENREKRRLAGCVHERDAVGAYNRALLRAREEERG